MNDIYKPESPLPEPRPLSERINLLNQEILGAIMILGTPDLMDAEVERRKTFSDEDGRSESADSWEEIVSAVHNQTIRLNQALLSRLEAQNGYLPTSG